MRSDGIKKFRRNWDKFYGQYPDSKLLKFRDQLCAVWGGLIVDLNDLGTNEDELDSPLQNMGHVARFQRKELRQKGRTSLQKIVLEDWLGREKHWAVVEWKPSGKRISANLHCLPATLAFCAIKYGDWFRICKNPRCQARYFIAVRKHQRYCTPDCAWPAKKAAKLRWWHAHKEEVLARQRGEQPGS